MYLPQYHSFPENDEWWGKDYTEWVAVKRAKPLYTGHIQPRIPLDGEYYDLDKDGVSTLKKQAELAKEYGIYGFSMYQYYFNGKTLMEKPLETLLAHPEIDLKYCLCWANETWTRTWYGLENQILIEQTYGDEANWREHFEYMLRFFKDERYIKVGNKPVYQIYKTFDIPCFRSWANCFRSWAIEEGFDGIYFISGKTAAGSEERNECRELIDGYYYFEPGYSLKFGLSKYQKLLYNAEVAIKSFFNKFRNQENKKLERFIKADWIYKAIANREYSDNEFPGLIPDWDNTPRRSYKGLAYKGTSPEKFKNVLELLNKKVAKRAVDFVYINAWNEWGEGAYMEPCKYRKHSYLEAVREVLENSNLSK